MQQQSKIMRNSDTDVCNNYCNAMYLPLPQTKGSAYCHHIQARKYMRPKTHRHNVTHNWQYQKNPSVWDKTTTLRKEHCISQMADQI